LQRHATPDAGRTAGSRALVSPSSIEAAQSQFHLNADVQPLRDATGGVLDSAFSQERCHKARVIAHARGQITQDAVLLDREGDSVQCRRGDGPAYGLGQGSGPLGAGIGIGIGRSDGESAALF
jgi:hypothetical protein